MRLYYIYILASARRTLYIGVTGNFENRNPEWKDLAEGMPIRAKTSRP